MYIYVRAQEKTYSVRQMCFALSVTECGYYKWKRNRIRPKGWQILLAEMHKILREHPDNENYGVERMMIALKHKGIIRSYSTVKRAMQKGNLLHESRRSPDGLTKADKKAERPENLIKQDFSASEPNEKWLTDITQVPCNDATLYIAPVLDCYRGEIISLSMDTNMKKELCVKAIDEAFARRKPGAGVIVHSDAGSQFTSREYKKRLGALHAVQSMSNVDKCYDNARMESWFATLKKEKIYKLDTARMTVEEVKKEIWRYTFGYYNTLRVTTVTEDGLPPSVYNQKATTAKSVA